LKRARSTAEECPEDCFSQGDEGFLAHEVDGALSGMDSHIAQMAMDAETPEEFNAIIESL
tara:strand:- start:907 stop:1086 length:180 start_codon:yes stop_codon:yes gene_type:complete